MDFFYALARIFDRLVSIRRRWVRGARCGDSAENAGVFVARAADWGASDVAGDASRGGVLSDSRSSLL